MKKKLIVFALFFCLPIMAEAQAQKSFAGDSVNILWKAFQKQKLEIDSLIRKAEEKNENK